MTTATAFCLYVIFSIIIDNFGQQQQHHQWQPIDRGGSLEMEFKFHLGYVTVVGSLFNEYSI